MNTRPDTSDMAAKVAQPAATTPSEQGRGNGSFVSDSQTGMEELKSPTQLLEVIGGNQNDGLAQTEKNNESSNSSVDNEIEYPSRLTKVAVGFSLALAIFLVYSPYFHLFHILI